MKDLMFKIIIMSCWIFFGFCVFFSSLKNQLILNENTKFVTNKFFPQGWGFFTKDPRDLVLRIYRIKKNKLLEIDIANHSFRNRLGFSRSARIIGYEMSKLAGELKANDWKQNLNGDIYSYINDKPVLINSTYSFKHLTKGKYLLKLYKPIPYMWAKYKQEKFNSFSVGIVDVK